MITKLKLIEADSYIPYENLALEEYLLQHLKDEECILYLWQNKHTVVIGRNQNAWNECRTEDLKKDGGYLARRLSGGGAVYHDLGNLNFTFLTKKENFDIPRQTKVLIDAIREFGIESEKSGRNDVLVDGKKISGHAYHETKKGCYHHGTIMLSVNKENLMKYLKVDQKKLKSNGVDSVSSRVANLSDFCPEITVDTMKKALQTSFEREYRKPLEVIDITSVKNEEYTRLIEKYQSWDWLFGNRISFENTLKHHFSWGGIEINYNVKSGKFREVQIYSDSLYPEMINQISKALRDVCYTRDSISEVLALRKVGQDSLVTEMIEDVKDLLVQAIN